MKRAHPALGIDLGTTNSAVAFVDSTGRPETIRNAEGGLSTPSVIFFDRDNPVIGIEARSVVEARSAVFKRKDLACGQLVSVHAGRSHNRSCRLAYPLRVLKRSGRC